MIKTIISYVIEKVIVLGFIAGGATYGFNYLYSETKKAALTEVYNSLHSKNNRAFVKSGVWPVKIKRQPDLLLLQFRL